MRNLQIVATTVTAVLLYLLFGLPVDVAQHIFIGWIAEGIREYTGLELPRLETALTYISFMMPLFAAIATLYLYHKIYSAIMLRKYQPVREKSRALNWRGYAAIAFLSIFVPSIVYGGYLDRFRPAIPGPTKYLELRHLSNDELRKRAFTVAGKLDDLSKRYVARQKEINGQYEKDREAYKQHNEEYEKTKAEYEQARASCFSIGELTVIGRLTGTPPLMLPGMPSQSASTSTSSPSLKLVSIHVAFVNDMSDLWAAVAPEGTVLL